MMTFNLSPLVRITLLSLYIALTLPLPFLAQWTQASISPIALAGGIILGAIGLYGVLGEKVLLDKQTISVTYPGWVRWLGRKGWTLAWSDVAELESRITGQGGRVYYFVTKQRDRAYLLPMRVAGFAAMVKQIESYTTIDTEKVKPLAQPWMYLILLGLTGLLGLMDIWTITRVFNGAV